ncbi:MAG: sodium:calcium antiporter, partial [Candidatus Hinthialibacter sp.]
IGFLVAGAHCLIEGAVNIARVIGVPERVIGLTLVAIGTSLPEIASSIVAAVRREPDLVLGNLVGSNIFNTLCILGVTTVICPITVNWSAAVIDLLVMLVITSLIYPFLLTGCRLGRREGSILTLLYMTYFGYLFFYV